MKKKKYTNKSQVNQCVLQAVLGHGADTALPPPELLKAATANIKKFIGA